MPDYSDGRGTVAAAVALANAQRDREQQERDRIKNQGREALAGQILGGALGTGLTLGVENLYDWARGPSSLEQLQEQLTLAEIDKFRAETGALAAPTPPAQPRIPSSAPQVGSGVGSELGQAPSPGAALTDAATPGASAISAPLALGEVPTVSPGLLSPGAGPLTGVDGLAQAAGGYLPLAGAAVAAATTGYNIYDALTGDFQKTDAKDNLLSFKGPQFWASVFGGGKDKYQQGRDSFRSYLQDNSFLDDDWQWETTTGQKVDMGVDGSQDIYLFGDKELQDTRSIELAQALKPLTVMLAGDSRQADEFQAIFTRAVRDGGGDANANIRKMYEDSGVTREQAWKFIDENPAFGDKEKDAFKAALDRAFFADQPEVA